MAEFSSNFLRCLSVWIGFVALMALGNTIQCFADHSFLESRLYTRKPESNVTGLAARLFGIWTLLSAVLRFACAIDIYNTTVYHLTFFSFFLALGHFLMEIYPYKSAELAVGVCAPLIVSSFIETRTNFALEPIIPTKRFIDRTYRGLSIILMTVGYFCTGNKSPDSGEEIENTEKKRKPKVL